MSVCVCVLTAFQTCVVCMCTYVHAHACVCDFCSASSMIVQSSGVFSIHVIVLVRLYRFLFCLVAWSLSDPLSQFGHTKVTVPLHFHFHFVFCFCLQTSSKELRLACKLCIYVNKVLHWSCLEPAVSVSSATT